MMKRTNLLSIAVFSVFITMVLVTGCSSETENLSQDAQASHKMLVDAAWVDVLIKGGNPGTAGTPTTYPGNGFVIIDLDTWIPDRIPGALKVSWAAFNKKPAPYLASTVENPTSYDDADLKVPADMQARLEELGIDHDTTVVIYSSWACYFGRVAWALMCAGVKDVRVLHGGLTAWKANGGAVTTDVTAPTPIDAYSGTIPDPVTSKYNATTSAMEAYMYNHHGAILLDTRTWAEFIGSADYHAYITVLGRIPESIYYPYLNMIVGGVDGKDSMLRDFSEVRAEMESLGATEDKTVAFICTIGQRSGFTCWYAYMMGYPDVRNYDSGWYGWIARPELPVLTGEPLNY